MKNNLLVVALSVVATLLVMSVLDEQVSAQIKTEPDLQMGRYQIESFVTHDIRPGFYVIDTATGDVWQGESTKPYQRRESIREFPRH